MKYVSKGVDNGFCRKRENMSIQEWFDKRKEAQIERRAKEMRGIEDGTPGLWVKCVHCDSQILKTELEDNLMVCPNCNEEIELDFSACDGDCSNCDDDE